MGMSMEVLPDEARVEATQELIKTLSDESAAKRDKFLNEFFNDETISFATKFAVANRSFRLIEVAKWGYRSLSGHPLYILAMVQGLSSETVSYAAANPKLEWRTINALLEDYSQNSSDTLKETFVRELTDEVMDEELMALMVARINNYAFNVNVIWDRARKLFGFDENVPPNWIANALKTPELTD